MLIGITGHKKTGKDTLANIIVRRLGYTKKSFAYPIKELLSKTSPFTLEQLDDQTIKDNPFESWWNQSSFSFSEENIDNVEKYFNKLGYSNINRELLKEQKFTSLRHLMQWFGTDFGRNTIENNIWINILLNSLDEYENIVISDVRFDDEAIAIRNKAGLIIVINRNLPIKDSHISEKGVSSKYINVIIDNNSYIYQLETNITFWHRLRFPGFLPI